MGTRRFGSTTVSDVTMHTNPFPTITDNGSPPTIDNHRPQMWAVGLICCWSLVVCLHPNRCRKNVNPKNVYLFAILASAFVPNIWNQLTKWIDFNGWTNGYTLTQPFWSWVQKEESNDHSRSLLLVLFRLSWRKHCIHCLAKRRHSHKTTTTTTTENAMMQFLFSFVFCLFPRSVKRKLDFRRVWPNSKPILVRVAQKTCSSLSQPRACAHPDG